MKKSRTAEFVLGLLGGIFGIISGFMAMMLGGVAGAFEAEGASTVGNLGVSAIAFSILAIVGCVIVKKHVKLGGLFMLIAGIGGIISISMFYILPGALLIIGSLMALLSKDNKVETVKQSS